MPSTSESDIPFFLSKLLWFPTAIFHTGTTMSFFQSCPHEILFPIFSHCILESTHPCQQLSSLERTCKQFRRIILDSSVWRTLHTNLFGNTLNSQASSTIDWKAQCKKNIVLLRGIQSSLNNKSNGNERVLHNCAVTLKELWKLVRSMSTLIILELPIFNYL
jgi:hypothetical protein